MMMDTSLQCSSFQCQSIIPGKGQPPRRTSQAGLYLGDHVISIPGKGQPPNDFAAARHAIVFDGRMVISIATIAMSDYV